MRKCSVLAFETSWREAHVVFRARDTGAGTIEATLRADRVGGALQVKAIRVDPALHRCGVGTKLYELAAKEACAKGLALQSDRRRTGYSEAFWRKQRARGRATCRAGSGINLSYRDRAVPKELRGKAAYWPCETYALDACKATESGLRGLAAPKGLEIREVETGGKNTFHFEAWLEGREVGLIQAFKTKVRGRTVYAIRDVNVPASQRRQGIATKLYEAAAQEACRRRSRLASVERIYGARSHDFWAKQKAKGRVEEFPGKPVPKGVDPSAYTPIYVLDCAYARDLSGPKRRKR